MWRGDYLHKAQVEEIVCVFFFSVVWFVYAAMCFPRPYTTYVSYAYGMIHPIDADSAAKHQQTKVNLSLLSTDCSLT